MTVVGQSCPVGASPSSCYGFGSLGSFGSLPMQKPPTSLSATGTKVPPWQLRKMQQMHQHSPPPDRGPPRDKSQKNKRQEPRLTPPKRTWECPLCTHSGNPSNRPICGKCGVPIFPASRSINHHLPRRLPPPQPPKTSQRPVCRRSWPSTKKQSPSYRQWEIQQN